MSTCFRVWKVSCLASRWTVLNIDLCSRTSPVGHQRRFYLRSHLCSALAPHCTVSFCLLQSCPAVQHLVPVASNPSSREPDRKQVSTRNTQKFKHLLCFCFFLSHFLQSIHLLISIYTYVCVCVLLNLSKVSCRHDYIEPFYFIKQLP